MKEILRKGWCPGALRPMMARDGLLVRMRITGGRLGADKARALAALAEFYGNGLFDLSARANLQMRGIGESDLAPLLDALADLDLLDDDPAGEAVRNVIASPLAGLGRDLDIGPVVAALEARLTRDPALHALPGKFGFLIDDGGDPSLAGVPADVRFDAVREDMSWRFWIGLGGTRDHAEPLGFCAPGEIVEAANWIGRTFLTLAEKTHPRVRRMEGLIERLGRYQTARAFGGNGSAPRLPYSGAILNPPPVGLAAANAYPALGIAAPFGRLDHQMLRAAADTADESGRSELRLTPWRCLLLPDVRSMPRDSRLTGAGFILDPSDTRLRIAACAGQAGCEHASMPTHADAEALCETVPYFEGAAIAIHVSGCQKGCAKASRTAITLVGRNGLYDLIENGRASDIPLKRDLDLESARAAIIALRMRA
jgi:precorrin-3B synthase